MTDRDDDDPRLLTGAYALDAVNPAEAEAFERALRNSADLREETEGLQDTAALLGLAATPVAPSARMKSELMAKLSSTPQLAPIRPAIVTPDAPVQDAPLASNEAAPAPQVAPADPAAPHAPSAAERRAQGRWFTRPAGILTAAAAATALFVGGGFVGTALVQGSSSSVTIDASAEQLAAITAASDMQRAAVDVAGGGTATVVWSNELGRSAVMADGLPTLPDGKVYEAWYIDADGASPAGTFTAAGTGTSWHVLDGAMSPGDIVGVTVEPKGGSEAPTTDPILVVQSA